MKLFISQAVKVLYEGHKAYGIIEAIVPKAGQKLPTVVVKMPVYDNELGYKIVRVETTPDKIRLPHDYQKHIVFNLLRQLVGIPLQSVQPKSLPLTEAAHEDE
jgi:hypothetical protein